jgi:hypothetical protein
VARNGKSQQIQSHVCPPLLARLEERTLLASVFFMHQSVGQGILDDQGTHPGLRSQLVAGRG